LTALRVRDHSLRYRPGKRFTPDGGLTAAAACRRRALTAAGVGSAWMGGQPSAPKQHNSIIIPLSADDPEGARNLSMFKRDGSWPGVVPKPLSDRVTVKDH
jgi:hypothetical protein